MIKVVPAGKETTATDEMPSGSWLRAAAKSAARENGVEVRDQDPPRIQPLPHEIKKLARRQVKRDVAV